MSLFRKFRKSKREKLEGNNELKREGFGERTMPEVEMEVESIRIGQRMDVPNAYALILKEKGGSRYLSIWVGQAEAEAIAAKLHSIELPGPLTHDFLCSIVSMLGAKVKNVVVDKYINSGYFASSKVNDVVADKYANSGYFRGKARFEFEGRLLEVDCRPSDAVALAIRVIVPIFATENILSKFSVVL